MTDDVSVRELRVNFVTKRWCDALGARIGGIVFCGQAPTRLGGDSGDVGVVPYFPCETELVGGDPEPSKRVGREGVRDVLKEASPGTYVRSLSLPGDNQACPVQLTEGALDRADRHPVLRCQVLMCGQLGSRGQDTLFDLAAERVDYLRVRRTGVVRVERRHSKHGNRSGLRQPLD